VQDYDLTELRILQRCTLFAPVNGHYYDPEELDGIRRSSWSRKTLGAGDVSPAAAEPAAM
jgi:hypothetical protein